MSFVQEDHVRPESEASGMVSGISFSELSLLKSMEAPKKGPTEVQIGQSGQAAQLARASRALIKFERLR